MPSLKKYNTGHHLAIGGASFGQVTCEANTCTHQLDAHHAFCHVLAAQDADKDDTWKQRFAMRPLRSHSMPPKNSALLKVVVYKNILFHSDQLQWSATITECKEFLLARHSSSGNQGSCLFMTYVSPF